MFSFMTLQRWHFIRTSYIACESESKYTQETFLMEVSNPNVTVVVLCLLYTLTHLLTDLLIHIHIFPCLLTYIFSILTYFYLFYKKGILIYRFLYPFNISWVSFHIPTYRTFIIVSVATYYSVSSFQQTSWMGRNEMCAQLPSFPEISPVAHWFTVNFPCMLTMEVEYRFPGGWFISYVTVLFSRGALNPFAFSK